MTPRAEPAKATPAGAELAGAEPAGAEPVSEDVGVTPRAKPAKATPAGAEPAGAEPAGAKPAGATPAKAKPGRAALAEGPPDVPSEGPLPCSNHCNAGALNSRRKGPIMSSSAVSPNAVASVPNLARFSGWPDIATN